MSPANRSEIEPIGETRGAPSDRVGVVVIGRNEGERLKRCLESVSGVAHRIYVDSGSSDGSVEWARSRGVTVVQLPTPPKFTAARARNAGLRSLLAEAPGIGFVQMVDGDCEVRSGWIDTALRAFADAPDLAVVFGRRRERFPERSVYNAMCDDEWNVPLGAAAWCGGDALMRVAALQSVGGYDDAMIAAEDSEMSMRMRKHGWHLLRIDAEMTLHDAAVVRFGQWWTRVKRGGHGFAELAHRHPDARWPNWRRTCLSIVIWGGAMPVALIVSVALGLLLDARFAAAAVLIVLLWVSSAGRIARRKHRLGLPPRIALATGVLLMFGKIPELIGLVQFHANRLRGRHSHIIEYKTAEADG